MILNWEIFVNINQVASGVFSVGTHVYQMYLQAVWNFFIEELVFLTHARAVLSVAPVKLVPPCVPTFCG